MRINTNIFSLQAQRSLERTTKALARSLERLSSGKRINSARDDAAGLAIATSLESQVRGLGRAAQNINDTRGMLTTAEGSIATQIEIVQRMRELAIQAANGTLSHQDRSYLNSELQQLLKEFSRITDQTNFNDLKLLDGTFKTKSVLVGTKADETIALSLPDLRPETIFTKTIGAGTLGSPIQLANTGGFNQESLETADVNNDGLPDLLAGDRTTDRIYIRLNNGDGTFTNAQTLVCGSGGDNGLFLGMALGDLNADGNIDVVQQNYYSGILSIWLGNGDGSFNQSTTISVAGASKPALADVNKDGKLDMLVPDTNQSIGIYLGKGDGTFNPAQTISDGAGTNPGYFSAPTVGDLDKDGNLDFVVTNMGTADNSVAWGNGDGTFTFGARLAVGQGRPIFADMNNDGLLDVITETFLGNVGRIHTNNGDRTFTLTDINGGGVSPVVGDVNNDGNLDMIKDGAINLGNGDGTSTYIGNIPRPSVLHDFNQDGNLDALGADSGNIYLYLGKGDGSFTQSSSWAVNLTASPYTNGVVTADFNGDGFTDAATGTYYYTGQQSHMSVLLQNTKEVSALSSMDISTQESAQNILDILDRGMEALISSRQSIGATQNRMEFAFNSTRITAESLALAKSQILDVDYAVETAELVRTQILQQAGISILGQANLQAQLVLTLLRF